MRKNDAVYLHHTLDAINQIETQTAGQSHLRFSQDQLIQDEVIRQLEVIDEACRNLSNEFRTQCPDLPCSQIIGLRNRLIHAYFDVNLGIIWDIVQADIPPLKVEVSRLLE